MIRPLRRCHRWIIPGLLLVLAIAAVLALTQPPSAADMDVWPREIADPRASLSPR